MITTNYRPTTSHVGFMRGMWPCGVTLGSGNSFGQRLKPVIEELGDPNDMSRESP